MEPFLHELLSDTRPVAERLLREPTRSVEELAALLDDFDAELVRQRANPRMDLPTAELLASGCRRLLEHTRSEPSSLRLAQVAIVYVVLDDDADGDTEGPFGFDDDVEVFNAVCGQLALDHLLLE